MKKCRPHRPAALLFRLWCQPSMALFVLIDCINALKHLGRQTVLRILTNCCKGSVLGTGHSLCRGGGGWEKNDGHVRFSMWPAPSLGYANRKWPPLIYQLFQPWPRPLSHYLASTGQMFIRPVIIESLLSHTIIRWFLITTKSEYGVNQSPVFRPLLVVFTNNVIVFCFSIRMWRT